MKILYTEPKLKKDTFFSELNRNYQSTEDSNFQYLKENLPLYIRLKYNQDSNYLPFRAILDKETDFVSLGSRVKTQSKSNIRVRLFNTNLANIYYYSGDTASDQIRSDNYHQRDCYFFAIDNIVYAVIDFDTLIPLAGLLVKNNTSNRVSIKKDKVINEAIGSSVYNISSSSVFFLNKDVLTKGHMFNTIGVGVKKLVKKYHFLETVSDNSIFDNMFNHKITAPKSFTEFEEFNSTLNTHLNQLINKYDDRTRL